MKVFRVWVNECCYGEYDSVVVVAESEEDVRSHLVHDDVWKETKFMIDGFEQFAFSDRQGEIHIVEVPTDKFAVILATYNVG